MAVFEDGYCDIICFSCRICILKMELIPLHDSLWSQRIYSPPRRDYIIILVIDIQRKGPCDARLPNSVGALTVAIGSEGFFSASS